ncbi:hypothetical protein HDZ31DRAFT_61381 [Schizophyllum fasciatum]
MASFSSVAIKEGLWGFEERLAGDGGVEKAFAGDFSKKMDAAQASVDGKSGSGDLKGPVGEPAPSGGSLQCDSNAEEPDEYENWGTLDDLDALLEASERADEEKAKINRRYTNKQGWDLYDDDDDRDYVAPPLYEDEDAGTDSVDVFVGCGAKEVAAVASDKDAPALSIFSSARPVKPLPARAAPSKLSLVAWVDKLVADQGAQEEPTKPAPVKAVHFDLPGDDEYDSDSDGEDRPVLDYMLEPPRKRARLADYMPADDDALEGVMSANGFRFDTSKVFGDRVDEEDPALDNLLLPPEDGFVRPIPTFEVRWPTLVV